MTFTFDAILVAVREKQGKERKYYEVSFDQNGEVTTLPCTEDVFRAVGDKKYISYKMQGQYVKGEYQGRVYTRIGVTSVQAFK